MPLSPEHPTTDLLALHADAVVWMTGVRLSLDSLQDACACHVNAAVLACFVLSICVLRCVGVQWVVANWEQNGCDLWEEIQSTDFFWNRYIAHMVYCPLVACYKAARVWQCSIVVHKLAVIDELSQSALLPLID